MLLYCVISYYKKQDIVDQETKYSIEGYLG